MVPTLSGASPTACPGPGTAQGSVSEWLAACPPHCDVPEHPPPPGPGRRLASSPRPRPLPCLLVSGQSVNGAPWTVDTSPPRSSYVGGLRMPCPSRHRGPEKGGSDPCRSLSTANPRAQTRLPRRAGLPGTRAEGLSLGLSPGLRSSRATPPVAPSNKGPGLEPRPPGPPRGRRKPQGGRARGAPVPDPRGTPGPRRQFPRRRPPHSPRHGRARAPPPSPRPGRLHRCAPGGGAERAQVTMTKQSRAPAVSE